MLQQWLNSVWYGNNLYHYFLWPFSLLFQFFVGVRRFAYQKGYFKTQRFPLPIIVVGNLTVGGTGKTPLVLYLVKALQNTGFKPAIISRGYGKQSNARPILVNKKHNVSDVGDEVAMLFQHCHCPIVVSQKRILSVEFLLNHTDCNVIVSDDGLQHYALERDIEILVIDGERRFGNGCCLPAGPCREPLRRLKFVDFKICNGGPNKTDEFQMVLKPGAFVHLKSKKHYPLNYFHNQTVHAFAGIGNPKRFFETLEKLNCHIIPHPFSDHYLFQKSDFSNMKGPIVMTEKDAVKCYSFADENVWYLAVDPEVQGSFIDTFMAKITHYQEYYHQQRSGGSVPVLPLTPK